MENRRRVTEEDLLITETLIAQSYGKLKQSVIQAPSRACSSVGQTVREHPYATAGAAIVAGVVVYGIYRIMTSRTSGKKARRSDPDSRHKGMNHMDFMQQIMPMIMPLVAPYIAGYLRNYLGAILSPERD